MKVEPMQREAYRDLLEQGYGSLIESKPDGSLEMTRLTITGDGAKDYRLDMLIIDVNGEIR